MSSIFQFIKNPYCWIYCSYTLCILFYSETKINLSLREKCPNTDFFLVRIFPCLDWIRTDTSYLSVFSPNARKYGPEKLCIWTPFTQSILLALIHFHSFSFVAPLVVICCHSLSLVVSLGVTPCHSLWLLVIRCHLLSFIAFCCHLLSLFVTRC